MKKYRLLIFVLLLAGCTPPDKYDPREYSDVIEKNSVLPQIVSYVFSAPPYTEMKDRFKAEHLGYYRSVQDRFSLYRYYISENNTHYFYLIRPANAEEHRVVAGHFKLTADGKITGFREVFVTPALPDSDLKGRCVFLFDEMVKGTEEPYLRMPTYVQWPNQRSYYDSTTYEWRLLPAYVQPPTDAKDHTRAK